ncbi:MAG: Uncharacterized protein Greene041619_212 [Candidatus Peregrinibacteria bacterium Greene0416_19]|nr:MAG: Uncharacterized protein Greene041619_212 [Candidatus Peregrinibacteria bacterium Greene0416_19]
MGKFLTRTALFGIVAVAIVAIIRFAAAPEISFTKPPVSAGRSAVATRVSSTSKSPPSHPPSSRRTAASVRIAVPFSPQAPFAEWDPLHEEACEEMALIMVKHYWDETPLSRTQAESELQELIAWEHAHGYGDDVSMAQLKEIAREYYGLKAEVLTEVSISAIKQRVARGEPLIVPAAGRDLGNPYFTGLGPWYHMLVVTGYDGTHFITNDPGTRRGEGYRYRYDVLLNAIHDWTGVKEEIRKGAKAILVVTR